MSSAGPGEQQPVDESDEIKHRIGHDADEIDRNTIRFHDERRKSIDRIHVATDDEEQEGVPLTDEVLEEIIDVLAAFRN